MTGTLGLVFLFSVALKRLLLLVQAPALSGGSNGDPQRFTRPESHRRLTFITTAAGLVFLGDAVVHVILAHTLPTAEFLVLSRITN